MENIDEFYVKGNLTIQIIKTILTKEQLLNKEQTGKKKKKTTGSHRSSQYHLACHETDRSYFIGSFALTL